MEIEYQHTIRYDGNRFSPRFPMVVGPRYLPGGARLVSDAARITPPVLKPGWEEGRTNAVSIRAELDAGMPLDRLDSAYHPIAVEEPSPSRRIVTLAGGAVRADRDFDRRSWKFPSKWRARRPAWPG